MEDTKLVMFVSKKIMKFFIINMHVVFSKLNVTQTDSPKAFISSYGLDELVETTCSFHVDSYRKFQLQI